VKRPINLRVSLELLGRVDVEADRLGQTRTKFVERALESALNGQGSGDTSSVSNPRRSGSAKETAPTEPSAPSRAPVVPGVPRVDWDRVDREVAGRSGPVVHPNGFVEQHRDWSMERQARLNAAKGSRANKAKKR
jgi:hypothetical protein